MGRHKIPLDLTEIRAMRAEGLTIKRIARTLHRDIERVADAVAMLRERGEDLFQPKPTVQEWSAQDLRTLHEGYFAGQTDREIGAVVKRTARAVAEMRRRCNLYINAPRPTATVSPNCKRGNSPVPQNVDMDSLEPVPATWDTIIAERATRWPHVASVQELNQERMRHGLSPFRPTEPLRAWLDRRRMVA